MIVRTCVLSLVLLLTVPAQAQTNALDQDTIQFVRRTFNAANVAYDAGDYEQARKLYSQVHKINATANITYNLARAEQKLSKFVDAARHFSACIRAEDAQPGLRQSAREALQEVERHVGKLTVDVSVDGADVFVDGESFGPSPIPGQTAYVMPGRHVLSARKDAVGEATRTVEVEAAHSVAVALKLAMAGSQQGDVAGPNVGAHPAINSGPTIIQPQSDLPTIDTSTSARSIVLWTGAGLTLASFGVATVFGLKAGASSNDAEQMSDTLRNQYGANACSNPSASAVCMQRDVLLADKADALRVANRTLWVGGFLGVVTAGVFFVWRPTTQRASGAMLAPQLAREGGGISVVGRF